MLKRRLLKLLHQMHPDGRYNSDTSSAVVPLKPKLRAALSHIALSVISPLPDTEPHLPLITCEYATELSTLSHCPAFLLQKKPDSVEHLVDPH